MAVNNPFHYTIELFRHTCNVVLWLEDPGGNVRYLLSFS